MKQLFATQTVTDRMTVDDVAAFLKVCRQTVYKLRQDPEFPKPRYIGPRSPRWKIEELRTWIDSQHSTPVDAA